MSTESLGHSRRSRRCSRGAVFVEALLASVVLAAGVGAGLLLFERWGHAAERLDERSRAFALAFAGCGRRNDLGADALRSWRAFDPRAFVPRSAPSRASMHQPSRLGETRESFACNERSFLSAEALRALQRTIAQRVGSGSR